MIKTGDLIPALIKSPITRVQISQFAAATNDFDPMHVDEASAKTKGYSGICAHPQLALAYAEQALRQLGDKINIVKLSTTFHKLIWPGDMLTAKGIVSNCYQEGGHKLAEIDVWVENQNHDAVLKGKATCKLK